jgi:hypothetical protein
MLERDALGPRFAALQRFLAAHQRMWKPRPFTHLALPWEQEHPALAAWLRARSLEEAEEAALAPLDNAAPAPLPQLAAQARALAWVGPLPRVPLAPPPARLERDVPGRKWQQVEAFARHLGFTEGAAHWVDWCGGKGHLGRRLAQPGQRLTCLEFDPALVRAGQALSELHGLVARHPLQDVLAADTPLAPGDTPVALHACGDLHVQLLRLAAQRGCRQLAVAPCCYNRTQASAYLPLSAAGQAAPLALDRDDLGLPANEAVTAGARERRQRDTSMARRLGFDLLQRHLRGRDEYLPTPSLPVGWLTARFADYCQHLAQLKGIEIGSGQDWAAWEARGWQRLAQVRNLERMRNLFRRPLELWLVLDRALYLREQGYQVRVGTFCDRTLTPRNLMILAERARTSCG